MVVGGGIAGLGAAWTLADEGYDVLVLEGSPVVGGKLRLGEIADATVDVGAESMLARRPEAVDLAREAGLEVVHPATTRSLVWSRGELRRLPRTLLGVPLDLDDLADSGVLSPEGLERARRATTDPIPEGDVSVARLVGERYGDEVVQRLVEPLLGGVYAGHADNLSARATVPQVLAWLRDPTQVPAGDPGAPVFGGLAGGMGTLPATLAASGRFAVRTEAVVRRVQRCARGFALTVGSARTPEVIETERLVLATPATPTARLLSDLAPAATRVLLEIEHASMAIVTLAVEELEAAGTSGFLVPPVDAHAIKAATYSFEKWAWVGAVSDSRILRASLGRHREERVLQAPDDHLVALAVADLEAATGQRLQVVDSHVQRWGGGLPQYAVGHLDRVAAVRAAVAEVPGLAVCGAAYDGVGIPAVIASARTAARQVAASQ